MNILNIWNKLFDLSTHIVNEISPVTENPDYRDRGELSGVTGRKSSGFTEFFQFLNIIQNKSLLAT